MPQNKYTKQYLEELSKVDINDIDPSTLKELTEIEIDEESTPVERVKSFLTQIENPYCFLINGMTFKISYGNHENTLDDCIYNYLIQKRDIDNDVL